jgi:hypothetical protein
MATKTDRILSYLPPTFRAVPRPTALYAVVDAFGQQLIEAENSLGAVMLSHWVDHADEGAEFITDLNCFAALYGLAPRGATKDVAKFEISTCVPVSADESVEQFRSHLKRYVRTFIEGTVTVQGVLRIVAEALDLNIADDYADMDTWWTAGNDPMLAVNPRTDDAASILFGAVTEGRGAVAVPAWIIGPALPASLNLERSMLRIRLDGSSPVDIDVAPHSRRVSLADVVAAINRRLSAPVAREVNGCLRLASLDRSGQSALEILDVPGDASWTLLGLNPHADFGSGPTAACLVGRSDLYGSHDLANDRYLRLRIDNRHVAEVDCAGQPPTLRTLPEIVSLINRAFGFPVAFENRGALKILSPTNGPASSIAIERAGAQDASRFLLGQVEVNIVGSGPRSARLTGERPLSQGVDLSKKSQLRIAVDGALSKTVHCAGSDPAKTQLHEIIDAINQAFDRPIASQSNGAMVLSSPTSGPHSQVRLSPQGDDDATETILGFKARVFEGSSSTAGRIAGKTDLRTGVDLRSQHLLRVSLDGGPPVEVDLWQASQDLKSVTLAELRRTLNKALGAEIASDIASDDGRHLILTSPSRGSNSIVAVLPVDDNATQKFITRAYITDEAAPSIFGFLRMKAHGAAATVARLVGEVDLSGGVDLRRNRYLRIQIDGETEDFDFASAIPIPRGATLAEIVSVINSQFRSGRAADDGKHLILTSQRVGSSASVEISDPAFEDAFGILLGAGAKTVSGSDGTGIMIKGTVDLSAGVDLSPADTISLRLDGSPPIEIRCAGPDPAHTTPQQLVGRINTALKATVASHDGRYIVIAPPLDGSGSELAFVRSRSRDATATIFGFHPPRSYLGNTPVGAKVIGAVDLRYGVDLTTRRFLTIRVDTSPAVDVDCAKGAKSQTRVLPQEIVRAINTALGAPIAQLEGFRLVLRSRRPGSAGSISTQPRQGGYAGNALFGRKTPTSVTGLDPQPATITGLQDLAHPIDLSERQVLRFSVDGHNPVDVNVAGSSAEQTTLSEIVQRVNSVLPGLATQTPADRLRLVSPTTGEDSSLEVLPLRALELIDFPPVAVTEPLWELQHGGRRSIDNNGAANSELDFQLTAPQGEAGMEFVNLAAGTRVRLITVLSGGETIEIKPDPERGVRAEITAADGRSRPVPQSAVLAGTLGAQAFVPFKGEWALSYGAGADSPPLLQLNDPQASGIVIVRALSSHLSDRILVKVSSASGSKSLFDVTLRLESASHQPAIIEKYSAVEIGRGLNAKSLVVKILTAPSKLVRAEEISKASLFDLARGISDFVYMNSHEARFDRCYFPAAPGSSLNSVSLADESRFAGGSSREYAVFGISRFSGPLQDIEASCFGPAQSADPPVQVKAFWTRFQPGAFRVNLPADLDEQFGARFDQNRFGMAKGGSEKYSGVVTEPTTDPNYLAKRVNAHSTLVQARRFAGAQPPAGWAAMGLPFMNPRSHTLTGGRDGERARMYVFEEGVPGLIELSARTPGAWGNAITVTAKKAGPVRFDVEIGYQGLRFENARQVALAGSILSPGADPLSQLTAQILKPAPVGVLHAKAAGVRADVTRDRTEAPPLNDSKL